LPEAVDLQDDVDDWDCTGCLVGLVGYLLSVGAVFLLFLGDLRFVEFVPVDTVGASFVPGIPRRAPSLGQIGTFVFDEKPLVKRASRYVSGLLESK